MPRDSDDIIDIGRGDPVLPDEATSLIQMIAPFRAGLPLDNATITPIKSPHNSSTLFAGPTSYRPLSIQEARALE